MMTDRKIYIYLIVYISISLWVYGDPEAGIESEKLLACIIVLSALVRLFGVLLSSAPVSRPRLGSRNLEFLTPSAPGLGFNNA